MKKYKLLIAFGVLTPLLFSCSYIPKNATPVKNFDSQKYLGKWYEIARIDFKFEKNLNNVTAEYSMNKNGSIKVYNKGYDYTKNTWKSSTGKAKFRGDTNIGVLKVSFFGPFYAGYNVIGLDDQYKYALVAGKNLEYLWILSRTTSIPEQIKMNYLNKASSIGYDTNKLIWIEHNLNNINGEPK